MGSTAVAPAGRIGYIELCDSSLAGSGIRKGDLALIDLMAQPEDGDLAAVIFCGQVLVRYFYREAEGRVRLEARNLRHPTIRTPLIDLIVIGRVLTTVPVLQAAAI